MWKSLFNFSSLRLASMSLPTPFKLKAIHALSYLKLFYVDSVLLHNVLTEETIIHIYMHETMRWKRQHFNAKQSTKKENVYTGVTFV